MCCGETKMFQFFFCFSIIYNGQGCCGLLNLNYVICCLFLNVNRLTIKLVGVTGYGVCINGQRKLLVHFSYMHFNSIDLLS